MSVTYVAVSAFFLSSFHREFYYDNIKLYILIKIDIIVQETPKNNSMIIIAELGSVLVCSR